MNKQQYHYCFKFIIVGNSGVGKSCLLQQYIEGHFKNNLDATIGVEFGQKDIVYKEKVIRINAWDTVNTHINLGRLGVVPIDHQSLLQRVCAIHHKRSIACLLVFDVTKKKTFHHLITWLSEIRADSHAEIMIVGNKIDQWGREVSFEEGLQLANSTGCLYAETSAKTGENVVFVFEHLVHRIYGKIKSKEIDLDDPQNGIKVGNLTEEQQVTLSNQQHQSCC